MLDQGLLYRKVRGQLSFVMLKTMMKSLTMVAHDLIALLLISKKTFSLEV